MLKGNVNKCMALTRIRLMRNQHVASRKVKENSMLSTCTSRDFIVAPAETSLAGLENRIAALQLIAMRLSMLQSDLRSMVLGPAKTT